MGRKAIDVTQTYDIHQTYQFNYDRGPQFDAPPSPAPEDGPVKSFLGKPVRSRLGIAAGLLLNSKWIAGYAERGFDILTYKTVRSSYRPCYDPPNWVFVESEGSEDGPVHVVQPPFADPKNVSSAVCFGMPSMAPEVWREDIRSAKQTLTEHQMLLVSVVATPGKDPHPEAVAADFCRCAEWAVAAGADAVEANFSCPNVCSAEGTIYTDPALSRSIAETIRAGIGARPLLIKIGHVPDPGSLSTLLQALNGVVTGLTLVNGITRPVLHRDGRPAFGPEYIRAGVLGRTIHEPSVAQVREASRIIKEHQLNLVIAAVGGASSPADVADFFGAGADAVLMGSSPMYLPDLAVACKVQHPEW